LIGKKTPTFILIGKKQTKKFYSGDFYHKTPKHPTGAFTVNPGLQCRKGFSPFPAFHYCTYEPHKGRAIFPATSSTVKQIMTRTALLPNRWATGYRFCSFLHLALFYGNAENGY